MPVSLAGTSLSCVSDILSAAFAFWSQQSDELLDVTDYIPFCRPQCSIRECMTKDTTTGRVLLLIDLGMCGGASIQYFIESRLAEAG